MGVFRRFFDRLKESDEARLSSEIRSWAERVPGTTRISEAPLREPVKLAGVVRRITVFPIEGQETLEALLYDGTGDANIVFMGRRGIQGMTLGTKVIVEGVLGDKRGEVRMVNPRFEFAS